MRMRFLLLLCLFAGGAHAALAQGTTVRAEVTRDEQAIIGRNQALVAAMTIDPDVVRRILDEMAKPARDEKRPRLPRGGIGDGKGSAASELDAARNPDLEIYMQRASPEAAYDLMQILKRVGAVGLGPKR